MTEQLGTVAAADDAPSMTAAVLQVARRQLGEVGPAALSLRSIAREIGVVPSALYRYLPGREAILTELIRTGYQRLGDAVRAAEASLAREDRLGRWLATWHATRDWALANPHEYALLYGTPVVGYRAPQDTIAPATIVVLTLAQVVVDAAVGSDAAAGSRESVPAAPPLLADAESLLAVLPELGIAGSDTLDESTALGVVEAWTTLFGAISFELFGHYERSITARADHLDRLARSAAARLGLAA